MKKIFNTDLNINNVGEEHTLYGWVSKIRNLGSLVFVDLRDRSGIMQVVFNDTDKDLLEASSNLKNEYCIKVVGIVNKRSSINPNMPTGEIELIANSLEILSTSIVLPFNINDENVSENLALKYRYLELRKERLQKNLIMRSKICSVVRNYLDKNGFIEIETPMLCRSTPEGARDYVVPSRINKGTFYALPQSPQIFKQLLMIGGFERYYQIAKCFRDEDLRADRQPEFTQIDMEMSFANEEDVFEVAEGMLREVVYQVKGITLDKFPRITYRDAMNLYGTDKPDTRYEMLLHDVTHIFKDTAFTIFDNAIKDNGVVKCIKVDGGNSSVIRALVKRDLVRVVEKEVYRYNDESIVKSENITLNKEQREAVDAVVSNINTNNTYLLYGVTGSGKTEVYINIIDSVIKMGKNAIMLVPEISLTPQIVSRFRNRFKSDVAVMHSGMSDAERYDEYRKIKNGDVKIVVGARSAVFSPFDNIGVIIIDEEQVTSYKQDNNPRYHTRDVALFRCKYHNCPLVLGSATPSLESFARAKKGVYKLLTLKNRANSKKMPVIKIVDLKKEHSASYIGDTLKSEIIDRLNKKEQVLLLLNRRGYSSMVTCKNCGYTVMCPNCDISLTYHKSSDMLRCHYCSYALKVYDSCPKCHCKDFRDYGIGTEKLEEEVRKLFGARVVRMDLDTTSNKKSHNKIIKDFMDYKYDVLVGTQMIAKGLDFPNVTLVGVINADSSLNVPDFRSSEYTFELLTQVSGRAGRSDKEGSVVIQTYNKDHYSIVYAKEHDYYGFFNYEMNIRKKLKYPPYYYLSLIRILSKDYDMCMKEANKVGNYLKSNLGDDYIVLGPSIANTFKVNNIYHFQCIVKYKNEDKLYRTLKCLDDIYKSNSKVRLEIDNSPVRM